MRASIKVTGESFGDLDRGMPINHSQSSLGIIILGRQLDIDSYEGTFKRLYKQKTQAYTHRQAKIKSYVNGESEKKGLHELFN